MDFTASVRKQLSLGQKSQFLANDQIAFQSKLNELNREIQHLQRTHARLQQASHRHPRPAFTIGKNNEVHILYDDIQSEMATLHGWILSLAETMFTLVRLEMGTEESQALRAQWRRSL